MKNFAFGLLIIICARISVIASELLAIEWLAMAPFDATGSLFLSVVIPIHLLVQGIIVSGIAVLMRRQAWLFIGVYAVVAMTAYGMMLLNFANPVADVVRYELSTLVAISIWVTVNRRRIFTRQAMA